jgi:hypothetical protein
MLPIITIAQLGLKKKLRVDMPTTSRLATMPSSLYSILVNIIQKPRRRIYTQELSPAPVTQSLCIKRSGSQSNNLKRPSGSYRINKLADHIMRLLRIQLD